MRLTRMSVLALAGILAGCESESDPGDFTPQDGTVTIDASSTTAFAYFSFADNGVVQVADPRTSSDWDLAVRRFEVRLNGGVAGPKGVTGFNLENNAGLSSDEVLALTPENTLAAFQAVDEGDIPASGSFTSMGLGPDFSSWFVPTPAGLVANPNAKWKLRRASGAGAGAFALIHVVGIVGTQTDLQLLVLEYRLQTAPGTLGAAVRDTIDLTVDTEAGLNLGTGAQVAPTGCDWDIRATRGYQVTVNAACSAGTFPLEASDDFAAQTRADDAAQYGPYLSLLSGPIPNSFTAPEAPFLYNLAGDNRLSPTFNTYLVQVGSAVFKLQLTSYYNPAGGQSGHPTIRYGRIR